MRFVIVGAGAIGGAVGGRLAAAGREVALIARGPQLAALRERGLRLESPDGTSTTHPTVAASPAGIDWRAGDVALLALKTNDAVAALLDLADAAPPGTPVVCLTNGVEAERLALRHFDTVYGAVVMMPATFLRPGVVQVWSAPVPGLIDLGRYPAGADDGARAIADGLGAAGFESRVSPDIMPWKRTKLLLNVGNAAEALCGRAARGSELVARARREAIACFEAAGLAWISDEEDAARRVNLRPGEIPGATRAGGSTWQSLARGSGRVECDYLNGEIALHGRLHGVPTPVNTLLQRRIAAAARAGAAPGSVSLEALAAEAT